MPRYRFARMDVRRASVTLAGDGTADPTVAHRYRYRSVLVRASRIPQLITPCFVEYPDSGLLVWWGSSISLASLHCIPASAVDGSGSGHFPCTWKPHPPVNGSSFKFSEGVIPASERGFSKRRENPVADVEMQVQGALGPTLGKKKCDKVGRSWRCFIPWLRKRHGHHLTASYTEKIQSPITLAPYSTPEEIVSWPPGNVGVVSSIGAGVLL